MPHHRSAQTVKFACALLSSAWTMIPSSLCLRRSTGYDSPSMCVYRHPRRKSVDHYTGYFTYLGRRCKNPSAATPSTNQIPIAAGSGITGVVGDSGPMAKLVASKPAN